MKSTAEAIESPALPLKRVNDIHGSHSLTASVLSVGHSVANDILEEDLENATCLLVDETADSLDASSSCQTANGRLGDALDVVAKDLPVPLGASFAQPLSSFASS